MAVIQHRQTYKFAFKNKLQQLLHLSSPILVMKWHKIQVQEVKSIKQLTRYKCLQFLLLSAYAVHKLYCLINVLVIFLITNFKTSLLYNLSWKSKTWNFMPLALTKYLYTMYNVHSINICNSFYFHCNFFVSFSLTWRQDFHIRW